MKRNYIGFSLLAVPVFSAACMVEGGKEVVVEPQPTAIEAISTGGREALDIVGRLQSRIRLAIATTETVAVSPTKVELPKSANGAFRLHDDHSSLAIEVGLIGATNSPGETTSGFVVYRAGHESGADIVHRPSPFGTEDYVIFEKNIPASPMLRYEVALGKAVAGLRLVSRALEFMDSKGTPRLRMAPPYAIDGDGKYIELQVALEDCAYDSSPAAPWGRTPIPPGKEHCVVRLQWDGRAKAPLVVDPAWMAATDMQMVPRTNAATVALPDGRALATGGDTGNQPGPTNSAELYDPASNTWAATDDLHFARSGHTATVVNIEMVYGAFIVGGRDATNAMQATTEFYDPGSGTWTDKGKLAAPRLGHTATRLDNGRVLIVGGTYQINPPSALNKAELFEGGFSLVSINMTRARMYHTATLTTLGKVVVVGGDNGAGETPTSAEIYEPNLSSVGAFVTGLPYIGPLVVPRISHAAAAIPGGGVMVVGGPALPPNGPAVELWKPGSDAWIPITAPMAKFRGGLTLTPVSATRFLAIGGSVAGPAMGLKETEFFELGNTPKWSAGQDLLAPRMKHEAIALSERRILVIGGQLPPFDPALPNAEIYRCVDNTDCGPNEYCSSEGGCKARKDQGDACNIDDCMDPSDCLAIVCITGFCKDGVCCDQACDGQCEACNNETKVGTCTPTNGAPVTNAGTTNEPKRDVCGDDPVCGGQCNGSDSIACHIPLDTPCKPSDCTGNKIHDYTCSPNGKCEVATDTSCAGYVCDAMMKSCVTDCSIGGDKDCAVSHVCNTMSQTCIARPRYCDPMVANQVITETSEPQSCGEYICKNDACPTSCVTAYDCFGANMVCTEGGLCKPFDQVKDESSASNCGCSIPGQNEPSRTPWLLAIAAALIVSRRKPAERRLS